MNWKSAMDDSFWLKQGSEPLFPDLLWSKPQSAALAGKLLLLGGYAGGFSTVAKAHVLAKAAGAGEVKAVLPKHLERKLPHQPDLVFVKETPSQSLGSDSRPDLRQYIDWADGMLLPGDLGHNSETTLLLEHLLQDITKPMVIDGDGVALLWQLPASSWQRPNLAIVTDRRGLQQLGMIAGATMPVTSSMGLREVAIWLHDQVGEPALVIVEPDTVVVAHQGRVSTTPGQPDQTALTAACAVWSMQQPSKLLEALTSAVYEVTK